MPDLPPVALEAIAFLTEGEPTGPRLHIVPDEATAEGLTAFLQDVLPDRRVAWFPGWDVLPFDPIRPTVDVMGQRMAILARAAAGGVDTVIVTLPTLLQKLPPVGAAPSRRVQVGDDLDIDALADFARAAGYVADDRVDLPGEIAFHGATVEVFAAGDGHPCRIEMDGATVKSLRCYDPITQRSTGEVTWLDIAPVTEFPPEEDAVWPEMATLFDHLPTARVTALDGTLDRAPAEFARLTRQHKDAAEDAATPPAFDRRIIAPKAWDTLRTRIEVRPVPDGAPVPAFARDPQPRRAFRDWHGAYAGRTVLVAGSGRERTRLARMIGAAVHKAESWADAVDHPTAIVVADLTSGWVAGDLAVIAAQDVLGGQAEAPARVARWVLPQPVLTPEVDDIVVHEDHGMARFGGLEPMAATASGAEAIRLIFRNDERLLVPAAEAGKIWRYGADPAGVAVDKLNGAAWNKRHAATRTALSALARKLVAAMADRRAAKAPKLVADPARFEEFVAGFAHSLTFDQATAVTDILADLASGRPMDRLLIGDVGYGKTEVALRAAAAVVLAGRQVAICAPTTVLARQHFETVRRRFAPLGLKVGHLSRLVSAKDARATRAGLADGSLRVVVGTHAVVGKGVTFADPGLMIIDEEQRFGAAQKKALRALGRDLHVLSMTATPIPRTLQTALIGLQDLSVLTTPPARRRPIRTAITPHDDAALTRALLRERRRGGQSYVVVPRVEDIPEVSANLKRLLPGLDIRDIHGGLTAAEIDRTMVDFAAGRGDVLLATAIIESGLDVARANTMIVLRPDLFGLAQLHQLRGRVGRGAVQAWCHLMPSDPLSDAARARLEALVAADRLGAGMALSLSDLDHRGAGDLLGDSQAGHVRRIGVGLYQATLAHALKAAAQVDTGDALPDYHGDGGHLPTEYIAEPGPRLDLYHRIAHVATAADIDRIADEMADRFGPTPEPAETLAHTARLRLLARDCGVSGITVGPKGLSLATADPAGLAERLADIEGVICDEGRLNLACPDGAIRAEILLERLQ
ncbi:DEAD/DEAH box helicase [Falsirhodobacter halotolerans]|uniref:DEAD/DEAH box helicase n=1 Tax=Falsirhodobacter halotolerans TaxID=1146892 RepID=UPI001FD2E5FD|nr:DEAD/DEAH box helicase [Falsirhodobacter halotolerans]MCJ8140891.1 DEAD/DEAH box helicase [Falsirhodobacter halotolerans]